MRTIITGCRPLVTLAGPRRPRVGPEMEELGIQSDGAMLIDDGTVLAVGARDDIEREAGAATDIVDVGGRLVLPGFVDAHTHLVFASNRVSEFGRRILGDSYQQIASEGGGIMATVRATRAATEEELFREAWRHAAWLLMHGTTTAEAKSGYGLTLDDELKILRVIKRLDSETPVSLIPTFLGAHAFPPEMSQQEYIALITEEMLPAVAEMRLAEYADIFCEEKYFTIDQSRTIMTRARELGLKRRMHVDQLTNSGGASLAAELRATTADHLEQTNADGIAALAQSQTMPVLLPGSVYALGLSRYPAARAMVEAGLPVVLATDFNPGSSPTPSMPMVMSLACAQMRLSPAEAITGSTINAAYSLDRGHDRGSLEQGKRADFVVLEANDPREVPYWFGANLVRETWVAGRKVFSMTTS